MNKLVIVITIVLFGGLWLWQSNSKEVFHPEISLQPQPGDPVLLSLSGRREVAMKMPDRLRSPIRQSASSTLDKNRFAVDYEDLIEDYSELDSDGIKSLLKEKVQVIEAFSFLDRANSNALTDDERVTYNRLMSEVEALQIVETRRFLDHLEQELLTDP